MLWYLLQLGQTADLQNSFLLHRSPHRNLPYPYSVIDAIDASAFGAGAVVVALAVTLGLLLFFAIPADLAAVAEAQLLAAFDAAEPLTGLFAAYLSDLLAAFVLALAQVAVAWVLPTPAVT